MDTNNKLNTFYFEGETMKKLYDNISNWQVENQKRLLSTDIHEDNGVFCCIALSNPSEVTIVDPNGGFAQIINGSLCVSTDDD